MQLDIRNVGLYYLLGVNSETALRKPVFLINGGGETTLT